MSSAVTLSSDSNTVININSISDIDNETNNIDNIDVQTEEVKDEILDNGDPTLTYIGIGIDSIFENRF